MGTGVAKQENDHPNVNRNKRADESQKHDEYESEDMGIINDRIDRIMRLVDRNARTLHEGIRKTP